MKRSISIRDLANQYCAQGRREGHSYLCHFITKSLGFSQAADIQGTLQRQWCAKFNINAGQAAMRSTILEMWNVGCVEFEVIPILLTSRQYREACLLHAARLHPDWILEF